MKVFELLRISECWNEFSFFFPPLCRYPYDGASCSNILSYNNLEIIDECETLNDTRDGDNKYQLRELIVELPSRLPDKFHQCPMVVTTPIWEPFVIGTRDAVSDGIEVLLIKTICEKLDMKAVFRVIDDATAFSFVTEDEETGFYSDLIKRKVDIMIGGLYDNEVSRKLLSSTIPYDSDEMTWCVARSGFAPNWMNVFAIFDIMLWIYAIICVFLCAIILFVFVKIENDRKENFPWSLMVILCYSIGVYGHYDPRKGFIRFYIGFLLLYGMHFSAAYHSFLLSVLTTPRFEHQVATIQEAIAEDYQFTGGENLKAFFETSDKVSEHLRHVYKPCFEMDKCLVELKTNDELAVAISRQHAINARIPLNDDDMFCFDKADNIFSFSVVMLLKKDHHLLPPVNILIRRIAESGFILKWKADSEYLKFKEDKKQRQDPHENSEPLNLGHLLGSFALMGVGVSIAVLTFGFEWIVYYLAQKRKIKFFKEYIEANVFYSWISDGQAWFVKPLLRVSMSFLLNLDLKLNMDLRSKFEQHCFRKHEKDSPNCRETSAASSTATVVVVVACGEYHESLFILMCFVKICVMKREKVFMSRFEEEAFRHPRQSER